MWTIAFNVGALCGAIHAIAPDHLGTIMTLSALCTPKQAFRIGASWGIGHSFGTFFICGVFITLRAFAVQGIGAYEHYGEYLVGASMVCCALYFAYNENTYLEEQEDGNVVAVPCSCHNFGVCKDSKMQEFDTNVDSEFVCMPCDSTAMLSNVRPPRGKTAPAPEDLDDIEVPETAPLIARPVGGEQKNEREGSAYICCNNWLPTGRDTQGAFLGVLQGICCPTGLVGVSFVAGMETSAHILVFLIACTLVCVVGTGLIASCWAVVTQRGMGKYFAPKLVYRGSCVFTLLLGVVWISANYNGFSIDYTDRISDQLTVQPGKVQGGTGTGIVLNS